MQKYLPMCTFSFTNFVFLKNVFLNILIVNFNGLEERGEIYMVYYLGFLILNVFFSALV